MTSENLITEKPFKPKSGWPFLFIIPAILIFGVCQLTYNVSQDSSALLVLGILTQILCVVTFIISLCGFQAVQPNSARVLILFGVYKGTIRDSGFFWVNPFYSKRKLSLRVRNFETGSTTTPEVKNDMGKVVQKKSRSSGRPSKVNDSDGNPIQISAVVVWKVINTAEALFEVDDYEDFVAVQSESALRNLASRHPYDSEGETTSLRGNTEFIGEQLRQDIQDRLDKAGVQVLEARISHLAYAQEIAAAMLQRQQAQAVVAARTKIVDGAVGMVQMALERLREDGIVELDDERRAAMVSNLLVVLCGDRHAQPVVNAGTLHN